ncbi:H-NS family nucleoid-associated regulatory protein [Dyella japonica]|uniref:Histidine biosynthesis protein n=1 Tax=Dyella japonica DSM 16301 TaxID=1440762 RepID=A0A0G9HB38_9GAMM|nr:H-NS histone family protein [Dyella japonica]KLD64902.1 histidine biosynthesis protein [Dyella japonica DSM 16301]
MAIDLKNLTPKELQALIANASAHMQEARVAHVRAIKEKIDALLSHAGLSLDDIYPSRGKKVAGKKGKTGSVAPKYRDPSDPSVTWSGRGRQPIWFVQALKRRGVTEADLLIDGGAAKAAQPKRAKAAKKTAKKAVKRAVRKTAGRKKA